MASLLFYCSQSPTTSWVLRFRCELPVTVWLQQAEAREHDRQLLPDRVRALRALWLGWLLVLGPRLALLTWTLRLLYHAPLFQKCSMTGSGCHDDWTSTTTSPALSRGYPLPCASCTLCHPTSHPLKHIRHPHMSPPHFVLRQSLVLLNGARLSHLSSQ